MTTIPAYIRGYSLTGTGWPWSNSGPQFKHDQEWIDDALTRIIFTQIGELKMSPSFGSALLGVVFENQGPIFESLADIAIREAIENNLPFVDVLDILIQYQSDQSEGLVDITVEYRFNNKKNIWDGQYGS